MVQLLVPILLVLLVGAGAKPEPGYAKCEIKKYKYCYNVVYACPKDCPYDCTMDCRSCQPICVGGQSSSPKTARCWDKNYPKCYNMEHACPNACPGGCEVDCNTCKPVCSKSSNFSSINLYMHECYDYKNIHQFH